MADSAAATRLPQYPPLGLRPTAVRAALYYGGDEDEDNDEDGNEERDGMGRDSDVEGQPRAALPPTANAGGGHALQEGMLHPLYPYRVPAGCGGSSSVDDGGYYPVMGVGAAETAAGPVGAPQAGGDGAYSATKGVTAAGQLRVSTASHLREWAAQAVQAMGGFQAPALAAAVAVDRTAVGRLQTQPPPPPPPLDGGGRSGPSSAGFGSAPDGGSSP